MLAVSAVLLGICLTVLDTREYPRAADNRPDPIDAKANKDDRLVEILRNFYRDRQLSPGQQLISTDGYTLVNGPGGQAIVQDDYVAPREGEAYHQPQLTNDELRKYLESITEQESPKSRMVEEEHKVEQKRPLNTPMNYYRDNAYQPDVSAVDHRFPAISNDLFFVALVAGCTSAAVFGVIAAGFCWYKLQKNSKAAADAEYPAYGVTGPNRELSPSAADRKLVQSAHMYHYQHQKQQMIAMEKATGERNASTSDVDSDDENEEGDYTVYECPGLAPTGEMEVKNPLFQDEPTPASPQIVAGTRDQKQHK